MGTSIELEASDGHTFGAYRAEAASPRGSMVVIQEIFGVNSHIRAVADRIAGMGYTAIAPQMFDRFARDFECGYTPDEITHARSMLTSIDWDAFMLTVDAARQNVKGIGKTGIVGFCMGGSVSFLASCRLDGFAASACYYGGKIADFAAEAPRCPSQMHFGTEDHSIPLDAVAAIQAGRRDCDVHLYAGAQHGFHCDERASFHSVAAEIAWERTSAFFTEHVG